MKFRFRSNLVCRCEFSFRRWAFITKIINNSLIIGYIPAAFKKAYITPLVKKPGLDEYEASNFRPVSSLSVLSKTLERAVSRQLERHPNSAGLFPSHQSAYRWHHSTETVLLRVCSDIITHLDKVSTHSIDLSATFDTVDRDILLERLLRTFGIQGTALEWFQSYLKDRMEHVLYKRREVSCENRVVWYAAGVSTWPSSISAVYRRP